MGSPLVNRERIREFFENYRYAPQQITGVFDILTPTFDRVDRRETELLLPAQMVRSNDALRMRILSTVARACTRPLPTSVVLISDRDPFPRPDWMHEQGYQRTAPALHDAAIEALKESIEPSFAFELERTYRQQLDARIIDRAGMLGLYTEDERFDMDVTGPRVIRSIRTSVQALAHIEHIYDPSKTIATIIEHVLLAAFCMDTVLLSNLAPLLALTNDVIPLGRKRDEPGTFLVRTA